MLFNSRLLHYLTVVYNKMVFYISVYNTVCTFYTLVFTSACEKTTYNELWFVLWLLSLYLLCFYGGCLYPKPAECIFEMDLYLIVILA